MCVGWRKMAFGRRQREGFVGCRLQASIPGEGGTWKVRGIMLQEVLRIRGVLAGPCSVLSYGTYIVDPCQVLCPSKFLSSTRRFSSRPVVTTGPATESVRIHNGSSSAPGHISLSSHPFVPRRRVLLASRGGGGGAKLGLRCMPRYASALQPSNHRISLAALLILFVRYTSSPLPLPCWIRQQKIV
ncbi:hypothetical protein C8F01DRAFT_1121976 [Mycena amicta]|nr:hypothetical protein C8F01DRAFT_1121976 [Mycena amicta]